MSFDRRPQFGTRTLCDPKNVFEHNAWDNVVWDEEQEREAKQKVHEQLTHSVGQDLQDQYEREAADFWDSFYGIHQNRFFKDRHWLFTEFPELSLDADTTEPEKLGERNNVGKATNAEEDLRNHAHEVFSDTAEESTDVSEKDELERLQTDEFKDSGSDENVQDYDLTNTVKLGPEIEKVCLNDTMSTDLCVITEKDSEPQEDIQTETKDFRPQGYSNGGQFTPEIQTVHLNEMNQPTSNVVSFPGDRAKRRILEVGCGVGNTVFPILQTNNDPDLMVYCCDFSSTAVNLVKENVDYDRRRCHAFVCDIADQSLPVPFPNESLDVIILIFVLSAIHPDKMQSVMDRLARFLKPGGMILFRDYGRYDMAQLRFKKGRCLSENFYVRGDGTRVYFFTQEELRDMMTKAGLVEKQNLIDRRLQVNRGKQLKMYRVWIQCKYSKPLQGQ